MNEARELLRIARELTAGPMDPMKVVRNVQKTLDDLDELSDNIEDAVETFNLHFRVAAEIDTDVDSQFDILKKTKVGLNSAKGAQRELAHVLNFFPEDKAVQRAMKEVEVMIRRFERHEAAARKVIQALSKKALPDGLKKYAQSVARIVKAKFQNPKDLEIVPWQQKDYKGGITYQIALIVRDVKSVNGGVVKFILAEDTSKREPAGVLSGGFRIEQMSAKDAAAQMLDKLRGWPGLKGAEETSAKRSKVEWGVKEVLSKTIRSMSNHGIEAPDVYNLTVNAAYRSTALPKEGASDVGMYRYEQMVDEEVKKCKKVLIPLLKPYMDGIARVRVYDGEKSWIYISVELK